MLKKVCLILCLFLGLVSARDFMGLPIDDSVQQESKPLPTWIFGGGGFLSYFLSSVDGGVKLSGEYRIHQHFSIDGFGQIFFGNSLYEVGLDGRYYFRGSLMNTQNDDFIRLGVSAIYMEKDGDCYFPPAVSLGYGRDVLFFERGNIMGRFEIRGSYIIGEPVAKKDDHRLVTQESHLLVNVEMSLLFF